MKKAFIFILSASLIVAALASCGTKPPKEEPTEPLAQTAQTDTPAASTPAPEPEPEPAPEPEPEEPPEETPPPEPQLFTEVNETVYATGTVNLRSGPGTENEKVGSLSWGESTTRIGVGIKETEAEGWSIIKLSDGRKVYVSSNYLSTTKPEAKSSGGTGGSVGSGGSNSKVSTPSSKQSTAPKQEAPAESSGSVDDEWEKTKAAELAEWGGSTQKSKEEIENGSTDGWTANYR